MRRMFGFLIGIFIGWLVGSTIALLFAPVTGDALRGQLSKSGKALLDEVSNFVGKYASDDEDSESVA